MEFFRSCPACGRRYHTKAVSSKPVSLERSAVRGKGVVNPHRPGYFVPSTRLVDGDPMVVDIVAFQQTYQCTHCGHEWSENQQTDVEAADSGEEK
jgi:predicted  nucleic acid-binding Zn-ribbon protein